MSLQPLARADILGKLTPGLGPPRPLQRKALLADRLTQTVARDILVAAAHPIGWRSGFPTGRPWDFATRPLARSVGSSLVSLPRRTRSGRSRDRTCTTLQANAFTSVPDPFLGSRVFCLAVPGGSDALGPTHRRSGDSLPAGRSKAVASRDSSRCSPKRTSTFTVRRAQFLCATGGDSNPTCHWAFGPSSSGWPRRCLTHIAHTSPKARVSCAR